MKHHIIQTAKIKRHPRIFRAAGSQQVAQCNVLFLQGVRCMVRQVWHHLHRYWSSMVDGKQVPRCCSQHSLFSGLGKKVNLEKLSQYVVWSIYSMFTQFFSFLPYQNRKSWNKKRENHRVVHSWYSMGTSISRMFLPQMFQGVRWNFPSKKHTHMLFIFQKSADHQLRLVASWLFPCFTKGFNKNIQTTVGSKPQYSHPPEQKKPQPSPSPWSKCGCDVPFVVGSPVFEGPHFNDLWTFALGADEADLQDEKGWSVFRRNRNFRRTQQGVVYTGTY